MSAMLSFTGTQKILCALISQLTGHMWLHAGSRVKMAKVAT